MLGKTLLIANPAARSGKAAEVAAHAKTVLERIREKNAEALPSFALRYTAGPKDATNIAATEDDAFDTVIALGGDGLANEVANGLMRLDPAARPQFALIPCGNGDDFARTIQMDRNPTKSLQQLESLSLKPTCIDAGNVNGTWFLETLSFGLDAAIALGTAELRKKTRRTGTSLYLQCGIDQLVNHRDIRYGMLSLDDGDAREIEFYLLAVQNGISYGGGFQICPEAKLTDGLLDICYATPTLSASAAVKLLLKAKKGKHTRHPNLTFMKARKLHLSLHAPLPTQVDGEALPSTEYEVSLHPKQLTVLMPAER